MHFDDRFGLRAYFIWLADFLQAVNHGTLAETSCGRDCVPWSVCSGLHCATGGLDVAPKAKEELDSYVLLLTKLQWVVQMHVRVVNYDRISFLRAQSCEGSLFGNQGVLVLWKTRGYEDDNCLNDG